MHVQGRRSVNTYIVPHPQDEVSGPLELTPDWSATLPVLEDTLEPHFVGLYPSITYWDLVFATYGTILDDEGITLHSYSRISGNTNWEITIPDGTVPNTTIYGGMVLMQWIEGNSPLDTQQLLAAFDLEDGTELWRAKLPALDGGFDRMAATDGRLFHLGDYQIVARDVETGDQLWRYDDVESQALPIPTTVPVYDLAAIGDLLIVTYGPRVYTLDTETGQEVWETSVNEGDSCITEASYIAISSDYIVSDDDVLLLSGVCRNQVVALDLQTGEEIWRDEFGTFINSPAMAVDENTVYFIARPDIDSTLWAVDVDTGEIVFEKPLEFTGVQLPISIHDGRLFMPSFFENNLVINIYERTPIDLDLELVDFPECGQYLGSGMEFQYVLTNTGDTVAEDVEFKVSGSDAINTVTSEKGDCTGDRSLECQIGSLAPGEAVNLLLTSIPMQSGSFRLRASVSSRTPDAERDNNSVTEFVDVLERPVTGPDLSVEAIEVTQAIQNFANDIPLITKRPAIVRVHVATGGGGVFELGADLHGSRNGTPLPNSPLSPIGRCNNIPADPNRAAFDDSLNFILPRSWRDEEGEITLRAELNPSRIINETDYTNNERAVTVSFTSVPPLCLKSYPVHTDDRDGNSLIPNAKLPADSVLEAESIMPFTQIRDYPQYGEVIEKQEDSEGVPYEITDENDESGDILDELWSIRSMSDDPEDCENDNARTLYVGGMHPLTKRPTILGRASIPGHVQVDIRSSGQTLAHETAHNYGRKHVDCGDPKGPDPHYPYDPCTLGPLNEEAFFGLDFLPINDISVIDPEYTTDFMSYHFPKWVSDYTWNALGEKLCEQDPDCEWPSSNHRSSAAQPVAPSPESMASFRQAEEHLLVSGLLMPDQAESGIRTLYRIPQAIAPAQKFEDIFIEQQELTRRGTEIETILFLDLVDSQGTVLDTQSFPAREIADGTGHHFGAIASVVPGTAGIRIRDDAELIASRDASPTTPTVTLTSPNASDVIGEDILIQWEAEDADGDELAFTLQYTYDDGQHWEVIAANHHGDMLILPTDRFPGGDDTCRIRIIATDGFLTAFDETGNFTVPRKAPIASIDDPGDEAVFEPGAFVLLRGSAFDPEDGPLADAALSWSLEGGDAVTITDITREFYVGALEEGTYTATLEANDLDGNTATDSITINVRRPTSIASVVDVLLGFSSGDSDTDLNQDSLIDASDITTGVTR